MNLVLLRFGTHSASVTGWGWLFAMLFASTLSPTIHREKAK